MRRLLWLVPALVVLTALAIGNQPDIAGHTLFRFPLPRFLAPVLDAVRASGRLFWPVAYTIVFVAITALSGTFGAFVLQWSDLITRIFGALIIVMGFVFLGFFGFAQREMRLHVQSTTGLVGAPLLGIALGLSWAPCTGPTLGAIVALSFNAGDPWRAALLGVAYSLGLGIPFLLVALGFGWATSATAFMRRHIRTVNIIGGALLIVLGLLMVTGLWTQIMSNIGAVMSSVILPL